MLKAPQSPEGRSCAAYIRGFIEGSTEVQFRTEDAVNIRGESFSERALRTRLGVRPDLDFPRFDGQLILHKLEGFFMPKSKSKRAVRYTPEFRRQMVELVSAGRKPSQLAREFGCTNWTISRWLHQSERDAGRGDGGLTTSERQELTRLRRENRQLKVEREILSKAAAWFAQETVPNSRRSSDS